MPLPEPEVIPPAGAEAWPNDALLELLAGLLDDRFQIPGTRIRFGLDPVLGLAPGVGDVITGMASFLFVFSAWKRGLPRITLLRMVTNIGIDTLLGMVPVAGDFFDFAWKSNRMNLMLLQRSARDVHHKQTWRDWIFFLALGSIAILLLMAPIILIMWLVHLLRK